MFTDRRRCRPQAGGDQAVYRRAVGAGGDDLRVRVQLEGVQVRAGACRERCETTIQSAGGYVVAITSVLASRSVALASCYLADLTTARTGAAHLRLVPGERGRISQRTLERMPGQTHARACLLDHAAELRELLDELVDEDVTVEVSDRALEQAAQVWSASDPG